MRKTFKKSIKNFKKDRLQQLLIFILVIGFLLRVLGVYPGYSPYHPDEGKAGYSSAWYMFTNRTLDLPHYHYPALIPTVELIFMVVVYLPILWMKLFLSKPDVVLSNLDKLPFVFENYISGRSDITIMYLSRYLTAAVGTLTIVLTYLVGKKLFKSRLSALLAATVLAVNMRAVSSSQLDLPDAYGGFFLLLAFYILLKLKERPTLKMYIVSGIGVALAISSKLQFFSLLPLMIVHLYYAFMGKGWREKVSTLLSKKIIFCLLALALTLLMVNIGPLTHWEKFTETINRVSQLYGFGFNKFSWTGLSFFYQIVLTPAVTGVALLGVVIGLLRYRFSTILVFSLIIVYLYYFLYLTRGWFYPRNLVSIIPFIALMSGLGLAGLWYFFRKIFKHSYFAIIFFILTIFGVLWQSTGNSIIHTLAYMQPWNMTSMRQCIRQNILSERIVAAHPTDKYFLFSLPSIDVDKKLTFIPLDFESSYSIAELQEVKADYAIVNLDFVGDRNSVWWMTRTDYWNKPKGIADNIFASLATKELFNSPVCWEVKPWQAVENNYVFVSVSPKLNLEWLEIKREGFDKQIGDFKKIDGFDGRGENLIWDQKVGQKKVGSIKVKAIVPSFPVVRWVSPFFPVKEGMVYKVEGWVKAAVDLEQKRRDGFLRLDFYQSEPLAWDESTGSLSSNLSTRYFGPAEWKKLEVVGRAPEGVKLATVSFQVSSFTISDFWLDDLTIFQSETQSQPLSTSSATKKLVVDEDVFVPNLGSGY